MMERYRTKQQTVELFREYQYCFEVDARRKEKEGKTEEAAFLRGKAEAYGTAAFELEHNMWG